LTREREVHVLEDDGRKAEIDEALETTDELKIDLARLKRIHILTEEERAESKAHVDAVVEALEEKLPE
jgi:hypothetical protein